MSPKTIFTKPSVFRSQTGSFKGVQSQKQQTNAHRISQVIARFAPSYVQSCTEKVKIQNGEQFYYHFKFMFCPGTRRRRSSCRIWPRCRETFPRSRWPRTRSAWTPSCRSSGEEKCKGFYCHDIYRIGVFRQEALEILDTYWMGRPLVSKVL